jgi:hypothetical protein
MVHQSVTPTGYRSERLCGFSKVALVHQVVFLVLELAGQGSFTVRPLGLVYGALLC